MKPLCLLAAIALALSLLACPNDPVGPGDAGQSDAATKTDGGGGSDAGGRDQAAADSAGRDAGFGFDLAGFDLQAFDMAGFDAGIAEYDGGEEPGVMCAGAACAVGVACCAGFGTGCDEGSGCNMLTLAVPCDGPEDCSATQECCVTGTSMDDFSIACVDLGTCPGTLVCTNSEACGQGRVCCSAQVLASLGADLGWCEVDHCGE